MKWSLYLGKIAGIKLFVHWTFLILVAWVFMLYFQMGYGMKEALVGLGYVLLIFVCVILHELGHALTARRYQIATRNITILPIGGLANMEKMPEKPGQELLVAIAGPMVNVVLAMLLMVGIFAFGGMPTMDELRAGPAEGNGLLGPGSLAFNLLLVNLLLFGFNLIPAFPMDGGRILRALLSYTMDRTKATAIAARVGQILAIGFVFAGFFTNFWLIFIGIFIFLGAGGEAAYESTRSILSGFKVKDVLMTNFTPLSPNDTLELAVDILLDGQEEEFLVLEAGSVVGVLTRNNLIKGLHEHGRVSLVSRVMQREFLTLEPEMELKDVFQKMVSGRIQICPVVDSGRVAGLVDLENINELLMVNQALKSDG